jgi:hypothetical protein
MNHVMLDLETLGVGQDACVLSIGAVRFNPVAGTIGDEFYMPICDREGRIELSTVKWWSEQNPEIFKQALEHANDPMESPAVAVDAFSHFCNSYVELHGDPTDVDDGTRIYAARQRAEFLWSNAPTFDESILRAVYARRSINGKFPIHFRGSRCFRTVVALAVERGFAIPTYPKNGHNALADAKYQAETLILAYRHLGLNK